VVDLARPEIGRIACGGTDGATTALNHKLTLNFYNIKIAVIPTIPYV